MAQQLIVCSVKDRLANVYSHPMYFATEGQAIRAFQDALADPQNSMSKHPDDYDLYRRAGRRSVGPCSPGASWLRSHPRERLVAGWCS